MVCCGCSTDEIVIQCCGDCNGGKFCHRTACLSCLSKVVCGDGPGTILLTAPASGDWASDGIKFDCRSTGKPDSSCLVTSLVANLHVTFPYLDKAKYDHGYAVNDVTRYKHTENNPMGTCLCSLACTNFCVVCSGFFRESVSSRVVDRDSVGKGSEKRLRAGPPLKTIKELIVDKMERLVSYNLDSYVLDFYAHAGPVHSVYMGSKPSSIHHLLLFISVWFSKKKQIFIILP